MKNPTKDLVADVGTQNNAISTEDFLLFTQIKTTN
jgi:hypothetical protein